MPTTGPTGSSSAANGQCEVFDRVGLPTGNTAAGIETLFSGGLFDRTRPPGEAGQISEFFQRSIESAIGATAPITCYWALKLSTQSNLGTRAFWVAFELPSPTSPPLNQQIYDRLAAGGATLVGLHDVQVSGQNAVRILIADIPAGPSNTVGGSMIISGTNAVVQIASSGIASGTSTPARTAIPSGANATPAPTTTSMATAASQPIPVWFKEKIESAFGLSVTIVDVVEVNTGGKHHTVFALQINGAETNLNDAGGKFSVIVDSSGASITSSVNATSIAIVTSEG
jgi:hypothetical protein